MEKDCMLDDRKTQTRASRTAAAAFVDTEEAVEEFGQVLIVNTLAGVIEMDIVTFIVLLVAFYTYRHILTGVGNGIFKEVTENAVQQAVIAYYRHRFRKVVADSDIPGSTLLIHLVNSLVGNVFDGNLFFLEEIGRLLQFVYKRHVVDKVGESQCLRIASLDEKLPFGVIDGLVAKQNFKIAAYTAHGRFQFVSYVAGHFLLELPVALLLLNNLLLGLFERCGQVFKLSYQAPLTQVVQCKKHYQRDNCRGYYIYTNGDFHDLGLLLWREERIAKTRVVDNGVGVWSKFFAESCYMDINRAVANVSVVFPYIADNLFAAEVLRAMLH